MPIGAVHSILGRIEQIETRFLPSTEPEPLREIPSSVPFDPFGEAYERAVAGKQLAPSSAAPTAVATRAAATAFSIERLLGVGGAGSAGRIGGFGPMSVPPGLAGYANGRVPPEALHPIGQHGHRLHGPAAVAWDQLVHAAAADGIEIRITDSYRSFDQQVDLAARKGLYRDGGLAATPGTSNHGWGLAVDADVRDPAVLDWMRANGWRFGFVEAVPREPWHWEYRPHQA